MPRLTNKSVEQIKPDPEKRREIPDTHLAGHYLIVQPSGAKSWAVRYRHGGRPRKLTLGGYPALGLAKARERAKEALQISAEGGDPASQKRQNRIEAADGRNLFGNVVAEFLKRHAKRNRSHDEVKRMFDHDVLPKWGSRQIQDITRRDVNELLDGLRDRGVGTMTNRVFAAVRKLFSWAIERDIVDVSPCAGVRPPVLEESRDRLLSDEEIRWFWLATDKVGYPFGPLGKLLLVTLQRLSEVAEMTDAEIQLDDRLWEIPKERAKNNRANEVPLSDAAMEAIEGIPRIESARGLLFTTTGGSPVSGFSRAKRNLDRAMLDVARQEAAEGGDDPNKVEIPNWRFHDLRRTGTSGMARLGQPPHVAEAILNHRSGTISGVAAVYNRYDYGDEKRAALEAWGRHVKMIASGESAKVIPLRAAKK
jgi:integrase